MKILIYILILINITACTSDEVFQEEYKNRLAKASSQIELIGLINEEASGLSDEFTRRRAYLWDKAHLEMPNKNLFLLPCVRMAIARKAIESGESYLEEIMYVKETAITSKDTEVKLCAIDALVKLNDEESVSILQSYSKSEDKRLSSRAKKVLVWLENDSRYLQTK